MGQKISGLQAVGTLGHSGSFIGQIQNNIQNKAKSSFFESSTIVTTASSAPKVFTLSAPGNG